MHFIITTMASVFMSAPGAAAHAASLPDLSAINPFECMTLSMSGVDVDIDANGVSPNISGNSELSMSVTLKSGKMIRVSF